MSEVFQRQLCRSITFVVLSVATAVTIHAQDASMESAAEAYNAARFDDAIELFTTLSEASDADLETRKVCFQYLGRAYIAKRMEDEARHAIRDLLSLQSPLVELNPDAEPPPLMKLYYEVRADMEGYAGERDSTLHTIAVIDFTNGSIGPDADQYDPLSLGLASMMINFLGESTDVKVVERERLHWLLGELDLQQDAGRVDQSTAVRAGQLLGAQSVLIGSFIVNGNDMYLGTRLVKVETGEILVGDQLFGKRKDVFDLIQQLSRQASESIDVALSSADLEDVDETRSLEAMMSYSEGLALLESEDYSEAYGKFMEALEHDPSYTRAELRVESLKPMLN